LIHLNWAPRLSTFTSDGSRLVSLSQDRVISFDAVTGVRETFRLNLPEPWSSLRLSPDGRVVILLVDRPGSGATAAVTELIAWNVAENRALGPSFRIAERVGNLAFSPDGRHLVTWSIQGPARTWDLQTGREAAPPIAVNGRIILARYSRDSRSLAVAIANFADPTRNSSATPSFSVQVFECQTSTATSLLLKQETIVSDMAFSSDGARLLTMNQGMGLNSASASVWDVVAGTRILGPISHGVFPTGNVFVAEFSPDGRRLATGGMDDARVWDLKLGTSTGDVASVGGPVGDVRFSPDGRRLATLRRQDGMVRVWNATTLDPLTPPLFQTATADAMRFDSGGRLLITRGPVSASGEVESRVWDLTGPIPGTPAVTKIRAASDDGALMLREQSRSLPGGRKRRHEIALQSVHRTNIAPATPPVILPSGRIARHPAISRNGKRLIAELAATRTAKTGVVRMWDFQSVPPTVTDLKEPGPIAFLALSPDGRVAAIVGSTDPKTPKSVRLWVPSSGPRPPVALDSAGGMLLYVGFSTDGRRFLTVRTNQARLWDASTGAPVGPPLTRATASTLPIRLWSESRSQPPPYAAFSPDGSQLIVTFGDAKLRRLDPETGTPLPNPWIEMPEDARSIAFSGDGTRFIVGLADGTVQVRDAKSARLSGPALILGQPGNPLGGSFPQTGAFPAAALDTTGRLALTAWARTIQIWAVETGLPLGPPLQSQGIVARAFLRDDGGVLCLTTSDTLEAWNLADENRPLKQLIQVAGFLSGRRITPEGTEIRLKQPEIRQSWSALHGLVPELPEKPVESPLDWHSRLAEEAEADGDWFAMALHLDPLVDAGRDDPNPRRRRAEAEANLGRLNDAAADFAAVVDRVHSDYEATLSLAVLRARLGDRDGFRSALKPLIATAARFPTTMTSAPVLHAAALLPEATEYAGELVTIARRGVDKATTDSQALSALAFAQYRAGEFENAEKSVTQSIAAYDLQDRAGQPHGSAADSGTPREWLLMAIVESRLGHHDDAAAWLDKSARWLDRAIANPTDPVLAGGMGKPTDRVSAAFLFRSPGFPSRNPPRQIAKYYLPTWRQILELRILRDEAEGLIHNERPAAPPSSRH
jgi:WD40 repeat protein